MSTDAVVIWGELLWDRFLGSVAPPPAAASSPAARSGVPPATSPGSSVPGAADQLGGAPANVAWHLAQAGGWAQLVTRVGDDDDGRRALARLDGLVDTSLVQIDPERATGLVTIAVEAGEPRYTLHPGRAWERIECTAAARQAIGEASVLVYGTLAQRTPEGLAHWQQAIAAARAGALKVYDANLRPNDQASHAIASALDHADLVKLNDREARQLAHQFGWTDTVAQLRAGGRKPRIVVVTHGDAGSTIYPAGIGPAGGKRSAPIEIAGVPAAPGGDNVGCGDAYLALLVFGMVSGWDLALSGRIASRWAAAVAEVRGATPLFDDDRIAALLEPA